MTLSPHICGDSKWMNCHKSKYSASRSRSNLRQSPRHVPPRILVVLQLSGEIVLVRAQVEVTVPAEAEKDGALPPFLAGEQGFVHQRADGVRRFRSEEHTSELQSLRHLVC